jgi:hypothetical protein
MLYSFWYSCNMILFCNKVTVTHLQQCIVFYHVLALVIEYRKCIHPRYTIIDVSFNIMFLSNHHDIIITSSSQSSVIIVSKVIIYIIIHHHHYHHQHHHYSINIISLSYTGTNHISIYHSSTVVQYVNISMRALYWCFRIIYFS